ncbi:MAG: mechanosensitive ion channel family protein [Sphingomonadaceae bacterium]|nr:mechanosensitive ion channel family protein [Sphingomonadaceae bacterium]
MQTAAAPAAAAAHVATHPVVQAATDSAAAGVHTPPIVNPLTLITAKVHAAVNGFSLMVPNLIAAIVFLAFFWVVGRYAARLTRAAFHHRRREDLAEVLGSLVKGVIYVVAAMFSAAIVFPSVTPSGVLGTLGIGSVAVGFAFKDILQNLLAGLLLLIQRPYRRGDQIKVKDYEGTIEHIASRATAIKTYDGRRVLIPNSDLYTAPVIVNTAFPTRRDHYDIGIGYGDDPAHASALFAEVIKKVAGVQADPPPSVIPWGLDSSTVTLRARWWTESLRAKQIAVRNKVILAIWKAAKDEGIDLPYPTSVVLFHDQTEETDGDRARQREGWPSREGQDPRPRADAQAALGESGEE